MTTATGSPFTLDLGPRASEPPEGGGNTSLGTQLSLDVASGTREGRAQRDLATALLRLRRARLYEARSELERTTVGVSERVAEADSPDIRTGSAPASTAAETKPLQLLRRWDGIVLSVGEETFRARLFDPETSRPEVEADIYVSDVAAQDRDLLRMNAVFYWHMGYRDPDGDRERVSKIRFQRLPPKTEADLARARTRAEERRKLHHWA